METRGDAGLAAVVEVPVEVVDERFDLQVKRRVQQIAVDPLSLARVPPLVEGGKDARAPSTATYGRRPRTRPGSAGSSCGR